MRTKCFYYTPPYEAIQNWVFGHTEGKSLFTITVFRGISCCHTLSYFYLFALCFLQFCLGHLTCQSGLSIGHPYVSISRWHLASMAFISSLFCWASQSAFTIVFVSGSFLSRKFLQHECIDYSRKPKNNKYHKERIKKNLSWQQRQHWYTWHSPGLLHVLQY